MYKLITPPAAMALSLADAKAYLDITKSNEDPIITSMIKAAVLQAQEYAWCQFVNATWMLQVNSFPGQNGVIVLGKGVIADSGITSVTYNDVTGTEQTLASTEYILDNVSQPCRLIFKNSPPTLSTTFPYVRITYTVGFGADDTAVPEDIRSALALMVIQNYDIRTDERAPLPKASERLLNQYRYKYFSF